jgi:hypothetical protein
MTGWVVNRALGVVEPDPTDRVVTMMSAMEKRRRESRQQALADRDPQRPPSKLAAYAGTYEDFVYGALEVTAIDGNLKFEYHGVPFEDVQHLHDHTFALWSPLFETWRAEFQVGADGVAESVTAPIAPVGRPVVFRRRIAPPVGS